jgi:hypothetical protein
MGARKRVHSWFCGKGGAVFSMYADDTLCTSLIRLPGGSTTISIQLLYQTDFIELGERMS